MNHKKTTKEIIKRHDYICVTCGEEWSYIGVKDNRTKCPYHNKGGGG